MISAQTLPRGRLRTLPALGRLCFRFLNTSAVIVFGAVLPARAEAAVEAVFSSAGSVPVSSVGYTATGETLNLALSYTPTPGTELTVVENTGPGPIQGEFTNLAQGQAVALAHGTTGATCRFIANYFGGTGNDLVLEWAGRRLLGAGDNRFGQLGLGTTTSPSSPTVLAAGVRRAAAGALHLLQVRDDGTLWAAGNNVGGELGDGTNTDRLSAVQVATGVNTVAAGYGHSLWVKNNGTLWAAGRNTDGQLGDGTTTNRSTPVQVASGVRAVAAGWYHTLYLKIDGTLWATGDNGSGQLGDETTEKRSTPVQVASDVASVAAGSVHSLFVKTDGTLWVMGNNQRGQLGDGTTASRSSPVQVASGVKAGAGGQFHSLFVKLDGSLWSMGGNSNGQLGDGTGTDRSSPVQVATGVAAVAGGVEHSLYLKTDGTLWTMGSNELGQQGDGTTQDRAVAGQVATGVTAIFGSGASRASVFVQALALPVISSPGTASVAHGAEFSGYTVTASGEPTSFGASGLPGGLVIDAATGVISGTPTQEGVFAVTLSATNAAGTATAPLTLTISGESLVASFGAATDVVVVADGYNAAGKTLDVNLGFAPASGAALMVVKNTGMGFIQGEFANLSQGQVLELAHGGSTYRFVANYHGGTGNDLVLQWAATRVVAWGDNYNGQATVPSGLSGVVAVSAGFKHSVALKSDGTVVAWGDNHTGQTTVPSGLSGVVAVSAGDHSVALRNDGTVVKWGDPSGASVPSDLNGVMAVAAGSGHTVALKVDGTVVAWGDNYDGQTDVPPGLSGVVAVTAGGYHSVALRLDGTVVAWGFNSQGQTTVPSGLSEVAAVTGGGFHSVALRRDDTAVAWGYNMSGQSTVPSGLGGVVAVTGGRFHSVALKSDGTVVAWGEHGNGQTAVPSGLSGVMVVAAGGYHTVALVGLPVPVITSPSVATGVVGAPFSGHTVAASGEPTSFGASGLPGGLTMDPATGGIGGMPTEEGVFTVTVRATNAAGTVTAPLTLTISGEPLVANFGAATDVALVSSGYAATGKTAAFTLGFAPAPGTKLTVVNNIGSEPIGGTFSNLRNGEIVRLTHAGSVYNFVADYQGGTGNDLVLEWAGNVLYALGDNRSGQMGNGSKGAQRFLLAMAQGVRAVAMGANHNLHVLQDGGLWAAGGNENGQLGDGTTSERLTWVRVAAGVSAVSAGYGHSAFVKEDGTLWTMGLNDAGQLGDGTMDDRATPVQVASGVRAVELGWHHSLFLKTDGTLWAMGANDEGQLGDGTTLNRLLPVQVAADVTTVAAGNKHSLFITKDRRLWAMGANGASQLGDGTLDQRRIPVNVAQNVTAIAAGLSHSVFLNGDGAVYAMGINEKGQLGQSPAQWPHTPLNVGAQGLAVAAGVEHTLFLRADHTVRGSGSNEYSQLMPGPANRFGFTELLAGIDAVTSSSASRATLFMQTLSLPVVTSSTSVSSGVGRAMGFPITADNRPTSFAATGLPGGLTINLATGMIEGTPTEAGVFAVTVSAANAAGATTQTLNLTIEAGSLTIWSALHFNEAERADPAISGPDSDPDHDGLANLLEYALGLEPRLAEASGSLPQLQVVADSGEGPRYIHYTYRRLLTFDRPAYIIEESTDLISWTPAVTETIRIEPSSPDDPVETVTERIFPALNTSGVSSRFVRLRVVP